MARNKGEHGWLGLLLFCVCGQIALYQDIVSLDNDQWPVATVLDLSFQINDEAQAYDIYLLVKEYPAYPYQNMCITYYLEEAANQLLHQELKNYPLFDLKTGKPLGNGLGASKSHTFLIQANHQFSCSGTYNPQASALYADRYTARAPGHWH